MSHSHFLILYRNLKIAIDSINPMLEKAGLTLSASKFTVFRTITFPLLKEGLFSWWNFSPNPLPRRNRRDRHLCRTGRNGPDFGYWIAKTTPITRGILLIFNFNRNFVINVNFNQICKSTFLSKE